jgi:hypothetical protein
MGRIDEVVVVGIFCCKPAAGTLQVTRPVQVDGVLVVLLSVHVCRRDMIGQKVLVVVGIAGVMHMWRINVRPVLAEAINQAVVVGAEVPG